MRKQLHSSFHYWFNWKLSVSVYILPNGGGGGISAHSHPVFSFSDLLGPVWMQPHHRGHMASIHHGHYPVFYTQLTEKNRGIMTSNGGLWIRLCSSSSTVIVLVTIVVQCSPDGAIMNIDFSQERQFLPPQVTSSLWPPGLLFTIVVIFGRPLLGRITTMLNVVPHSSVL